MTPAPLSRGTTPGALRPRQYGRIMCRSIKTLRPPYAEQVTDEDIHAAALQYVRKISGFRAPAGHNAEAFSHAVDAVAAATATLLGQLEVRSPSAAKARAG
jgi:hypothetical protein